MLFKFVVLLCTAVAFTWTGPLVLAQYGQVKPCPEELKTGFDSINQADSKKILMTLAGQEFAGRGTGQPGYLKAAQFLSLIHI